MFRHPTIVVVAIISGINTQTQEIDDPRYGEDDLSYFKFFPYVVSVTNSSHSCSGSILTRQHVLSKAVRGQRSFRLPRTFGFKFSGPQRHKIQVKYVNSSDFYDVAVITLQKPLPLGGNWAVVSLMDRNYAEFEANQEALVLGWGMTPKSNQNGHRRGVYVELATWKECLSKHASLKYYEICTVYREDRQDVCYGDPGSPLLVHDEFAVQKSYLHRYVQVGIMSWIKGCGKPDSFAAYVNIGWVGSWIDEILKHAAL